MGDLQEYERVPLIEMRERIVTQLKLNYAHDNLDDVEFEKRVEAAHAATSKRELIEVIRDLPKFEEQSPEEDDRSPIRINRGRVQETDTMAAILGGTERKGVWRPARRSNIIAVMGGVDLDFSEAELPPGETVVSIFAVMGGCDIYVPEELNVEVQGIPILGGIENHAKGGSGGTGPLLRIKAFVLMGGVDIKVKRR